MISRVIDIHDVEDALLELGPIFKEYTGIPGDFKGQRFISCWGMVLSQGLGVLFKYEHDGKVVGLLGAMLVPDIFDGTIVATESFWFVHPDHRVGLGGVKLFYAFEKWAKEVGAERMVIAHFEIATADKLGAFYQRHGR